MIGEIFPGVRMPRLDGGVFETMLNVSRSEPSQLLDRRGYRRNGEWEGAREIVLCRGGSEVTVSTWGARLNSWTHGGVQFLYKGVAATYGEPDDALSHGGDHPTLPNMGKCVANPELRKHGIAEVSDWTILSQTEDAAVLSLRSEDTLALEQGITQPFEYQMHISIGAEGSVYKTTQIYNRSQELMFVGPGYHPFFNNLTLRGEDIALVLADGRRLANLDPEAVRDTMVFLQHQQMRVEFGNVGGVTVRALEGFDEHPANALWVWSRQMDRYICLEHTACQDEMAIAVVPHSGKQFTVCYTPFLRTR